MRAVHWLFVVSLALFLAGIGFIVAAARTAKRAGAATTAASGISAPAVNGGAADASAAAALTPAATVLQIMTGIVDPSSKVIWNAVSTTMENGKTEEHVPRTDAEWAEVAQSAALIIESARLMLDGHRAIDQGGWRTTTTKMAETAGKVIEATKARNPDDVFVAGGDMYETCDSCHARYARR
jgi:hypothetical protein